MTDFDRLSRVAVGARGDIRRVVFHEAGRRLECFVPDDSLWGAVKDNLILSEYERGGISLREVTGTVVDAGAHVGLFSLRVAPRASKVIALEPHPINYALLRLNLLRNGLANVQPVQEALWHERGEVDLCEGPRSGQGSLELEHGTAHRVSATSLDAVVAESGPIDLLKLDIEGAEFDVLAGASPETLRQVRSIAAELHMKDREGREFELAERLRSLGFQVTLLDPPLAYWKDSVSRLVRNWRVLERHTRLKVIVLLTYVTVGLLDAAVGVSGTLDPGELKFMYALNPRWVG